MALVSMPRSRGREVYRVRGLSTEGGRSIATYGGGRGRVVVSATPDHRSAAAASMGLRRVHHVVIEVDGVTTTCTVAGSTRSPVRRSLSLPAALALAQQGVPTFLADRTGA